jgi:hypothetical protein
MGKGMGVITVAIVSLALTSCTAANSAFHILSADQALQKARGFDADALAPYQYTMSEEYLKKARLEAADSEHKVSMELSKKAAEWADQAIIAIENRGMKTLQLDSDEALPEAGEVDLLRDDEAGEVDLLGEDEE